MVIAYVGEEDDDIKYCCGKCDAQLPPLGSFLEVGCSFLQKLEPARFCSQCGALLDCRDEDDETWQEALSRLLKEKE